MKVKGEASNLLQDFVVMVKTQFGKDVKIIRSDNGLEFLSGLMQQFYNNEGFYIKQAVSRLLNKMGGLRENTDIFSMLLELSASMHIYHLIFGGNVFSPQHT